LYFLSRILILKIEKIPFEIVKTNVPVIEQSPAEQEEIVVLESKDKDLEKPLEIVKNDEVTKQPVYKVIEGHSADAIADEGYFPQLSNASAQMLQLIYQHRKQWKFVLRF
jgi:hypothetical protein